MYTSVHTVTSQVKSYRAASDTTKVVGYWVWVCWLFLVVGTLGDWIDLMLRIIWKEWEMGHIWSGKVKHNPITHMRFVSGMNHSTRIMWPFYCSAVLLVCNCTWLDLHIVRQSFSCDSVPVSMLLSTIVFRLWERTRTFDLFHIRFTHEVIAY